MDRTNARQPVLIGLDACLDSRVASPDQAVLSGLQLAIEEINARGGVLGGRPLRLMVLDNRGLAAHAVRNLRAFVDMPELVAFLCGRTSAMALEQIPFIHQHGLVLMSPWAGADAITRNGRSPNWAFRVGPLDSWAIDAMLDDLCMRGVCHVGLLLPESGWGRSLLGAARRFSARCAELELLPPEWFAWYSAEDWRATYEGLCAAGAGGLMFAGSEADAAALVRCIAAQPPWQRLPVAAHWGGGGGGDFAALAGSALRAVDFRVVQGAGLACPRNDAARALRNQAAACWRGMRPAAIPSAAGIALAYDALQLLALGIERAGSTDRLALRDALERLSPHEGVIRRYAPAFTAARHEATRPQDLFLAAYVDDGCLLPEAMPCH